MAKELNQISTNTKHDLKPRKSFEDKYQTPLSSRDKLQILKEAFYEIFPKNTISHQDQIKDIFVGKTEILFHPKNLLLEKLAIMQKLATKIKNKNATKEEVEEFFSLLDKVNQFITILNNLKINIPHQKKPTSIRLQRLAIKTPIHIAEKISQIWISLKKEKNKLAEIKYSVEEFIAFQGLESVRKKILTKDSFFSGTYPKTESQIETTSSHELHKLFSRILREPFSLVKSLGIDPNLPENHPKKILELLKKNKISTNHPRKELFFHRLNDAIYKHEVIASLLNMEFSYWRRFSLLNLETIKSTLQKLSPDVLRAITFDETQIVPGVIDLNKLRKNISGNQTISSEEAIERLNYRVLNAIQNTFLNDFHSWTINNGAIGELLKSKGVTTTFCTYNRSLENSLVKNKESITVPRSAFALLRHSNTPGKKFDVSLKRYNFIDETSYHYYHERMLEAWIDSEGDIEKTKTIWNNILPDITNAMHEDEKSSMPNFEDILSKVFTLPCVLLPDGICQSKTVNKLQQELTSQTNELRSHYVTASMIITFGIDETGNLAVSSSNDHSNWDGKQSGDLVNKILTGILKNSQDFLLSEQKQISEKNSEPNIDTTKITSSSMEDSSSLNFIEKGNSQIQSYVKAESFIRVCTDIGSIVRELTLDGFINPNSKLKNPAVIMQLILINYYRKILNKIGSESDKKFIEDYQEIGMLMGNTDITVDLDLAPVSQGFDFELFMTLSKEQKKSYLLNLALVFEIALEHTNMTLIKRVAESIPYNNIQEFLNWLSRTKFLIGGTTDLAGKFMISNFGLPRIGKNGKINVPTIEIVDKKGQKHIYLIIRNSGPAQTDFQEGSMTIVGSTEIDGEFFLSICYKYTINSNAIRVSEEFKEVIENFDNIYEEWQQQL